MISRRLIGGVSQIRRILIILAILLCSLCVPSSASGVPERDKYDAVFFSPNEDERNSRDMLERSQADVITFGHRVIPTHKSDFPSSVQDLIPDGARVFALDGPMQWQNLDDPQEVTVQDDRYFVNTTSPGIAIINRATDFRIEKLLAEAETQGTDIYLGLPLQNVQPETGYQLDSSNLDATLIATQAMIDNYGDEVEGFYLTAEMPVRDSKVWQGHYDLYEAQMKLINEHHSGATVLLSPYLSSNNNSSTGCLSLEEYQSGMSKLLSLASGTNLLVAPQDGLGSGTTMLTKSASTSHCHTAAEVFGALADVAGPRLLVNIEHMRPGGRTPETREPVQIGEVIEQNEETTPFVSGKIAYFWWQSWDASLHKIDGIDQCFPSSPGRIREVAFLADTRFSLTDAYDPVASTQIALESSTREVVNVKFRDARRPPDSPRQPDSTTRHPSGLVRLTRITHNGFQGKVFLNSLSSQIAIIPSPADAGRDFTIEIQATYAGGSTDVIRTELSVSA